MSKFAYLREGRTAEAYGNTYEIPTRTVAFSNRMAEAEKKINGAKNALEQVAELKKGIDLIIGEGEAEKIFTDPENVDLDEIYSFWVFLRCETVKATTDAVKKYSVNPDIRKDD